MSIEVSKPDEEAPPLQEDIDDISKPRRIALFVEPSPFAYVSGYKNRFQNFIKYLREMGDEVMVVTTQEGVPQEFYGAKCIGSRRCPDEDIRGQPWRVYQRRRRRQQAEL